jgi:hypothetical protein
MSSRPAGARPLRCDGWKRCVVAGHLRLRRNQAGRRLVAVLGLAGDIADRLVQQDRRLARLRRARLGRQRHHRIGRRPRAQLRHALAVDEHQAALDIGIRLAARTQAALGQKFGNPDTLRIIHGRAFYPAPMLSYRHAFHAGNHADILKHLRPDAVPAST